MKYVITLLLLSQVLAVIPWDVEPCQPTIKKIAFETATLGQKPAKGTDNNIVLYGTAQDYVALKEVLCKAYLNGILVNTISIPNDSVYDEDDPVIFKYVSNFPSFTPSGKYLVTFEFYSIEKEYVACGGIKFTL